MLLAAVALLVLMAVQTGLVCWICVPREGQRPVVLRYLGYIAREMSVVMRAKTLKQISKVPVATRFALRNVTSMQEKIHTRDHGEELASGQILMLQTGVEQRSTRKLCHRKPEVLRKGCTCSGA